MTGLNRYKVSRTAALRPYESVNLGEANPSNCAGSLAAWLPLEHLRNRWTRQHVGAAPNTMLTLSAGIMDNDLDSYYRSIPSLDFSREVLVLQNDRLLVIGDAVSGWTDLGNPNRVVDALARERLTPAWLVSCLT